MRFGIGVRTAGLLILAGIFAPSVSLADPDPGASPDASADVVSIGQPPGFELLWGLTSGYVFDEKQAASSLNLGLQSEFLLPQLGFLDVTFEGTLGYVGSDLEGGPSASLRFPYVNPGIEYNLRDGKPYFKLTALGAPRRGGLFGRGDRLRVDFVPAKQWVEVGFSIQQPFRSFRANRPRNRHIYLDRVDVPSRPAPPELYPRETVESIRTSMVWMDRLLSPRLELYDPPNGKSRRRVERSLEGVRSHAAKTGRLFAEEDSAYHACLDLAFAAAAGGDTALGRTLAGEAEQVLLDRVLIPVNLLFGRLKKPVNLSSFSRDAVAAFDRSLGEHELDPPHRDAAAAILRRVLDGVDAAARAEKERWDDSRMVWLPLNYGLRPCQIDTQDELNEVLARVLDLEFIPDGEVRYLFDDDFFYFYRNLLLETRRYQVTIVHDVRNRSEKRADQAAWAIVAGGYLEAFIRAVGEMNAGTRDELPQFFLFLDEHYYRENRSGRVIDFLESLYRFPRVRLEDSKLEAEVRGQVERLAEAVEASPVLRRRGEGYLRRHLKVHVNITQQFHPTFKEDAVMRDHRKIAFRDVFEEDPASGIAVFTGLGIGEYYLGPTWEDRSLVLRGPELVRLKSEVRELFLEQGYPPEDVPEFLRPRQLPLDYAARCRALGERGWCAQALIAMNEPGFREKKASVAKMALYNLMPAGSLILVPDSIWSSDYWASILFAASLRGLHVYAVAPDRDHAPSDAAPTLELIRETLASMALARETLAPELEKAGGSLHLGVFVADYDVCDARERVEAVLKGGGLGELAGEHLDPPRGPRERFLAERDSLTSISGELLHVTEFGRGRRTKLHQKTQFFVTREGIEAIHPEDWGEILDHYLGYQRGRCRDGGAVPEGLARGAGAVPRAGDADSAAGGGVGLAPAPEASAGRAAYFMTAGSQNQDRRGMLLDGEVLVTVAGKEALVGLADFIFVLGTADWIHSSGEVDRYFPREGGLLKTVTRWIRNLI